MSDYQPMSAPPPEGYGSQPGGAQPVGAPPPSIRTCVNLIWAIVALSVISLLLTFLYLDDIVESAAANLPQDQQDAARVGAIIAGVIGFLVFGALWIVLAIFLRKGKNWARIVLTVLAAVGFVFGLIGLGADRPIVLTILAILQLVLQAALLFFLWRKDSSAYLAPRPAY